MIGREQRLEILRDAAQSLLDKMARIEASPEYESVWVLAANHGMAYRGENWKAERERLAHVLEMTK